MKRDIGVVLDQIGLRRGAGDDDHLVVGLPVVQTGDDVAVRRDDAQCDVHVGQGEIDFLGALRGNGEVGEDDVYLAGLQILDAVGGLGGDEVHLHAQIFAQTVGKVDVVTLILAVLIHIAERVLIREDADVHSAVGLDLIEGAVNGVAARSRTGDRTSGRTGSGRRRGAGRTAAGGQCAGSCCSTQAQQERTAGDLVGFHRLFSFAL